MPKDLLHYWVPATARHELQQRRDPISIGSEQLSERKVQPDDTIWIVTVEDGTLLLVGRVVVEDVVGRDEAIARLGTNDLWDATYTVIAKPGTVEPLRQVNLSSVASELTFKSRSSPRLTIVDGKVNPQQLQSTRHLTPESVELLEERWAMAERSIGADENEGAA
jgi:hypothetical protein